MRQNYLRAAAGYRINQPTSTDDEHIANTELLLKGEGSDGQTNNTFVDSSASSHTITRNGDTTQGSFSPFSPKGWSMYVDGTGPTQGIVGPTVSSILGTGTGNWTVEFWHRFDGVNTSGGTATWMPLIGNIDWYNGANGSFWLGVDSNQNVDASIQHSPGTFGTNAQLVSTTTLSAGSWYHIAVVKQSNTGRLYINGTQEATVSLSNLSSSGFHATSNTLTVGRHYNNQGSAPSTTTHGKGHFSNVRVTSSAVYPDGTTFTPSTEPLAAITNCKLLTLQDNRYVDNSFLNSTITAYDEAAIKPTSPFSGNRTYPKASYFSGEFDGSNDYLRCDTALDDFTNTSDNFTIEAWFNSRSSPSVFEAIFGVNYNQGQENNLLVGVRDDNGTPKIAFYRVLTTGSGDANYGSFQLNTWNHIAATYDGSSVKLYLNGTQIHSVSGAFTRTLSTCSFCIGGELDIIGGVTNYPGNYFDGYISNVRVVKDVLYTTTFTPSTAPLTPVANTKLLTLQDNYLVDHSSSGHSITNNGGVTLEPESPFSNSSYPLSGAFYSGNFDGTNDNLTIPDSSAFDLSSGDFTVEGWIKPLSNSDTMYFGQWIGWGWFFGVSQGTLQFASYSGGTYYLENSGVAPSTYHNKWTHIAATREGNTLRIFVNGEKEGGDHTLSHTFTNSSGNFEIGSNSGSQYYNGYISNVRIVKGTALYTSDFTVPSEPLTAVSGTTLLTLQDATIQDNSASSHSITNNGATVTEIAPFGAELIDRAGSIYSDGYYDYLRAGSGSVSDFVFGTGDFTVEAWVYRTGSNGHLFDLRSGSNLYSAAYGFGTGNLTTSGPSVWDAAGASYELLVSTPLTKYAWNHVAYVRKSQVLKIYVNGVEAGSASATRNLTDGGGIIMANANTVYYSANTETLDGYLSDLRVIKGTALYTSNFTPPTAPLQPITNTKLLVSGNNGGVEDSLGKANCETNGNIAIDTSVKKFGVGSFEGGQSGSDYLRFPADASYDISNGVFTIECWFRNKGSSGGNNTGICAYGGGANALNSSTGYQYNFRSSSTGELVFVALNSAKNGSNDLTSATGVIPQNTWHYVVVVGNGSTYSLFVDGTRVATNTTSKPHSTSAPTYFSVGGFGAQGGASQGCAYYDDFRFTKGVARYDPTQTSHTVPTKTHPTI